MKFNSSRLLGRGVPSDFGYFKQVSVSCGVDSGSENGSGLEGHVTKEGKPQTEAVSTMCGLAAL